MVLALIQVILTASLVVYAAIWRRQQSKRRAKTWDGIISQLSDNDWGIEEITERYLYKSEVQVTTKDVWPVSYTHLDVYKRQLRGRLSRW